MTTTQVEVIRCIPCLFPTARHPQGLNVLLGIRNGDTLEVKRDGFLYKFPIVKGSSAKCANGHVTDLPGA